MRRNRLTLFLIGGVALQACACASTDQARSTAPLQGRAEVSVAPLKPDPARLKQMGLTSDDVEAPVALSKPAPQFPAAAVQRGISGTVRLRCVIRINGSVGDCEVRESLSSDCDAAALAAVETWEYTPTKLKGVAVPAYVDININYHVFR